MKNRHFKSFFCNQTKVEQKINIRNSKFALLNVHSASESLSALIKIKTKLTDRV